MLELLRLRPDLATPIPRSFSDLALRTNSTASTLTAMAGLTAADLAVLEAACALAAEGRFGVDRLGIGLGLGSDSAAVAAIADRLFARALLWGSRDDIRVPSGAREAIGRYPCGLDPTPRRHIAAVARVADRPQSLREELGNTPDDVSAAVQRAAWGPADLRPARDTTEAEALRWLDERGLLIRDDLGNLLLPREVALAIRGGLLIEDPEIDAPDSESSWPADSSRIAADFGHAADQLLRRLDRLMTHTLDRPLSRQGNGAIRARDWDAAVAATGMEPTDLALLLGVGWELVWLDDDGSGRLQPTVEYATAADGPREDRWAAVVSAWLRLGSTPAVEAESVLRARTDPDLPELRRQVLLACATVALPQVAEWLRWYRPRRPVTPELMAAILAEARDLGLLSPSGPAPVVPLIGSGPASETALADALRPLLPALSEHLILQADLTATALGPLPRDLELRLSRVAEWESGGAAAVFRFTPDSVKSGLAKGEDADDLHSWLAQHSRTPVPQALTVLIDDSARTQARMSVVAVAAVLRCDDTTAAAIGSDPELTDVGLHLLAPGLYGSRVPAADLVRRLRERGHQVDAPDGATAPLPGRRSQPQTQHEHAATPERIVRSLRRVEERAHPEQHPPEHLAPVAPHQVRDRLRAASQGHLRLWLRFSDDSGSPITHLVEPLSLSDGEICAFDLTSNEIQMIPVSRIVAAAEVGD